METVLVVLLFVGIGSLIYLDSKTYEIPNCSMYPDVSVLDEDMNEVRKVDLLVRDTDKKYMVDWVFTHQCYTTLRIQKHYGKNVYIFNPDDVLKKIVDNETWRTETV